MRKDLGASAGVLALLGLLVHMQIPHSDDSFADQPGAATAVASSTGKPDHEQTKEEPIEGPWLATEAFFGAPSSSLRQLESPENLRALIHNLTVPEEKDRVDKGRLCRLLGVPDNCLLNDASEDRFSVIATVADPSHTHLALFLDQQTEAIERSVQNLGWQFAGQWLPWGDYFSGDQTDINGRRIQRRLQREQEEMPGILVFRKNGLDTKYTETPAHWPGLFVFLVPETVTAGINIPSFHTAMNLARVLSPQGNVGLLAPTFSGSFPSLETVANQWKSSLYATVYTGSASNSGYADAFKKMELNLYGGIFNSDDYKTAVCTILKHYDLSRKDQTTALLKEDEGGFQQSLGDQWPCRIQTFIFSRDISHLRNAYKDNFADTVPNPYSDQPPRLSFTIQDPNRGEDSIPTFSQTQTPLMQEAVLANITGEIEKAHIHTVLISATNRLDALFLLRALRVACPDTRIIIDNPSLLFVSAADREALTGAIFLSPYPMSFQGDAWLDKTQNGDRIAFSDAGIEGLYNVSQLLLKDIGAWQPSHRTDKLSLHSYQQPGQDHPGVWVLTLTRNGFFPIDLSTNTDPRNWFKPNPDGKGGELPKGLDFLPSRGWLFTVLIVFIVNVLFFLVLIRASLWNSGFIWLNMADNPEPKLGSLLTASLSLSALMWVLAWPWWNAQLSSSSGEHLFDWRVLTLKLLIVAGWLVPLAALVVVIVLLFRHRLILQSKWQQIRYVLPVVLYGPLLIIWCLLCGSTTDSTGLFFRLRSVELYSGSSPSLPLAIGLLGFCCFALFDLRRYGLAGAPRSRLHINKGDGDYRNGLRLHYQRIEQLMNSPWTLSLGALATRMVPGAALVLVCFLILGRNSLSAFEPSPYNLILLSTIALILLLLARQSYDLWALGAGTKEFLDLIQIHPQRRRLHNAVERISKHWPKRTIWSFNRTVSQGALEREMLYRLDWRAATFPEKLAAAAGADIQTSGRPDVSSGRPKGNPKEEATQFRKLLFAARHTDRGVDRLQQIENLKDQCAKQAGTIYDYDLKWDSEADPGPELTSENAHAASEDFVALQFCQFVSYLVDQIKRMAVSLSLSFVLLIALFNSYSPESPQLVARLLVAIFLLIGVFVWRVFSQMERDPVLSLIGNTRAGQLSGEFWTQLAAVGSLPLLGVLGHLFPSATQFLFQWIAPGVQQLH
jgi:hypothetical protein